MDEYGTAVDVVVAGAGMAGLVAGATASELGTDVMVIEKGPRPGGSMALSGGTIWTYDSVERANEVAPRGNSALQSQVVEGLEDALNWLESVGVELTPLQKDDGWGIEADTGELTSTLVDGIKQEGGTVRTDAPLSGLITSACTVAGVRIAGDSSGVTGGWASNRINADAVVIATGGFQGNGELVERYLTDRTDRLWLRANPHSTGDGFLAARDAGAATTPGSGWFYGHNMAAPPADVTPETYVEVTQYYGPSAVAVGADGRRFVDESACVDESELAVATARRVEGRAYYVLDAGLYDEWLSSSLHVGTIVEQTRERGGLVVRADSLEGISDAVRDWPLNGSALVESLTSFNTACRDGGSLDPPRRSHRTPVDEPPFYVVAVQPGITTSTGGLAVDEEMHVRSRPANRSLLSRQLSHTSEGRFVPVPGLFAAGADVGNIHNGGYIGGLATALVTGRIAGRAAAARSREMP